MAEHTASVNSPKKASDNIVSLPAPSHDRGLALTSTSTETGLRALAKLGGWGQRQKAYLSHVSRKERGNEDNKSIGLWGMGCHEVVWRQGISKFDMCIIALKPTALVRDPQLTAGWCRGGPHVDNSSSGFCLSFSRFVVVGGFWGFFLLLFLATESQRTWRDTLTLQWIPTQYCCLSTKQRSKPIHSGLHDNLLQKTLQKIIRSHVLRGTYIKFQVSILHRNVELLLLPNAAQMNSTSLGFFSLMNSNHIFLILAAKWKPFLMCQEAHLQLINSQGFYAGLSTFNFTVQKNKCNLWLKQYAEPFHWKWCCDKMDYKGV